MTIKYLRRIGPALIPGPTFDVGDAAVLAALVAGLYVLARLAFNAPTEITRPQISLDPRALPWYALLSTGRMFAAYCLSLLFSLTYGYAAARSKTAERIMLPVIDVLQSVPILSFLPVVVLSLTAILPQDLALELGSIVLIFTSQAWNMTFSFYQSMTTIPAELREAARIFRLNAWLRFKTMELPFAAIGLIWNSMVSFAGGWFFLMAAEIFTVGKRNFRLPGLGSYLQTAANAGDLHAIAWGLIALVTTIVLLDQFMWRPLLAWSDKFKLETVEGDEPMQSWAYDLMSRSWLLEQFNDRVRRPIAEAVDRLFIRQRETRNVKRIPYWVFRSPCSRSTQHATRSTLHVILWGVGGIAVVGLGYAGLRAGQMLAGVPVSEWLLIAQGGLATLLRVAVAQAIALAWTVPIGVAVGTNRRLANVLVPVVQIVASIPATALFPVFLVALVNMRGGLDVAAVLLMLMGTQWYVLFNIIAGAAAIPQDLMYTTATLGIRGRERWRTLILPALFPYLITGIITASGGAWNASIVAEHVEFAGQTRATVGLGATIAGATRSGNYPLLLAATISMIVIVVFINRFFWRRLYALAEERYRLE
jgi:NitT/TauT family transport system permease protein